MAVLGWLAGWEATLPWLDSLWHDWLAGRSAGCLAVWLVGWLAGCWPAALAGCLVGRLAGCMVAGRVGWLAGQAAADTLDVIQEKLHTERGQDMPRGTQANQNQIPSKGFWKTRLFVTTVRRI